MSEQVETDDLAARLRAAVAGCRNEDPGMQRLKALIAEAAVAVVERCRAVEAERDALRARVAALEGAGR